MKKKDLRFAFNDLRNQLSTDALEASSLAIANRCLVLPIWDFRLYHIFLSIPEKREVDTAFLIPILQGKDKDIAVPRVTGQGTLAHFLLTDNTVLRPNAWGIPEPIAGLEVQPGQIDVVFIPLLAFDRKGYRVGYGGGYYDRFLAGCRPDTLKVGLSFFGPVEAITDLHPGDIPMDYCVTPGETYAF